MAVSGERFLSPDQISQADYEARGLEILAEMGVEDPEEFGSLALSAGDPDGRCTGTLAESVGRHDAVRQNVGLIVDHAKQTGVSPREAAETHPFFSPYLARDKNGQTFQVASGEDVKKN